MIWTSSANYIFSEMLLLGIAMQDWFAAGTKQCNFNLILILFNLVSINEKMCSFKRGRYDHWESE